MIAAQDHSHDVATQMSLSLPLESSPSPPPPPSAAPGTIRRLPLEADQNAANFSLPSIPERAGPSSFDQSTLPCGSAGAEAASPGSPPVHCSQYQLMRQSEDNDERAKVVGWLAATTGSQPVYPGAYNDGGFYESDYASSQSSYGYNPRNQSPPAKLFRNGKLLVHRAYTGRIPLCYYATGLQTGRSHDYYECFDERDMLWARRVRFHIDRLRH